MLLDSLTLIDIVWIPYVSVGSLECFPKGGLVYLKEVIAIGSFLFPESEIYDSG